MSIDFVEKCAAHRRTRERWVARATYSVSAWHLDVHRERSRRLREWRASSRPAGHLDAAIQSSRYLLTVLDENDQPACAKTTWSRAVSFLKEMARQAWKSRGIRLDAPDLLLGPDGSVDLHWKGAGYEMLVNVPADASAPITYYGDDTLGNSAKGNIASGKNWGLLLWLTTKQ